MGGRLIGPSLILRGVDEKRVDRSFTHFIGRWYEGLNRYGGRGQRKPGLAWGSHCRRRVNERAQANIAQLDRFQMIMNLCLFLFSLCFLAFVFFFENEKKFVKKREFILASFLRLLPTIFKSSRYILAIWQKLNFTIILEVFTIHNAIFIFLTLDHL